MKTAQFTIKHLARNEYGAGHEEVPEGHRFGFWRVVEHTGAGWFPLPGHYSTLEGAEKALREWQEGKRK